MTEQRLNGPQIRPSLQEMSGKRMPQGVGRDRFRLMPACRPYCFKIFQNPWRVRRRPRWFKKTYGEERP